MKPLYLAALILFAGVINISAADIIDNYTVSPPILEVDLDREISGYFNVENNSDQPHRINIEVSYFKPEEIFAGVHTQPDVAGTEDIAGLVVVSPRVINLPAGQKRKVRFTVKPDGVRRPPGEYRANLVFKPVPDKKPEPGVNSEGVSMRINWILEIRLPVYVTIGKRGPAGITANGVLTQENGKHFVRLDVGNETVWRYPVEFNVYDKSGKIGSSRKVVLRQTKRDVSIELSREPEGALLVKWEPYMDNVAGAPGQITIQQ
ncbi:MAG: hypothetical protein PHQ23_07755 [Candidatus Wallbacteria bacterium]|nr:hypothetical protein [Candidatus Wallbacteria bacterium]